MQTLEQKTDQLFYPTGELMHECHWQQIDEPLVKGVWDSRYFDNAFWIRTGEQTKWDRNGQIIWQLKYDERGFCCGSYIRENPPARKGK
jgi:hypothetical protein